MLFVPLAHRMGFYKIKMEMEDLCLKYLNPTVYYDILHQLKGSEKKRIHYLNRFCIPIMMTLEQHNINYTITSRSKSISSMPRSLINVKSGILKIFSSLRSSVTILIACSVKPYWAYFSAPSLRALIVPSPN